MHFFIRLAGITVEVDSVHDRAYYLSKAYIVEPCAPDITVRMSQADIAKERSMVSDASTDSNLETLAVYRKIAEGMLDFGVFLMHGTVVCAGGKAYMFTAPSGTGKSTHVRKWLENLPDAYVVNGDKPLIIAGDVPMACGTPWAGKEGWQTNAQVPLAAVVLMERSENNSIRPVTYSEAFPELLRQTYHPSAPQQFIQTIKLLKTLDGRVSFYSFTFNNLKDDAFSVAYAGLVGGA